MFSVDIPHADRAGDQYTFTNKSTKRNDREFAFAMDLLIFMEQVYFHKTKIIEESVYITLTETHKSHSLQAKINFWCALKKQNKTKRKRKRQKGN